MKPLINNFLGLFYPQLCVVCGRPLSLNEKDVCSTCACLLPHTHYAVDQENPLAKMFYGRLPLFAVSAEFFFSKKGKIQKIMHNLKYHGDTAAGIFLGHQIGTSLMESPLYHHSDCLIPIPLHRKKENLRGYNQSRVIAEGISEVTGLDIVDDCLERTIFTETQTHKSREERQKNVEGVFMLKNAEKLHGKKVILVDDVLTTGATLSSAGSLLLQVTDISVGIATAACATN